MRRQDEDCNAMVVRLRLARHGTRSNPFYHLVAIQNTKARDALPIEKLGEYDPVPKPEYDQPTPSRQQAGENRPGYNGEVIKSGIHVKPVLRKRLEWNEDRIRYWLGVGAQPSKPVFKLLYRVRRAFFVLLTTDGLDSGRQGALVHADTHIV